MSTIAKNPTTFETYDLQGNLTSREFYDGFYQRSLRKREIFKDGNLTEIDDFRNNTLYKKTLIKEGGVYETDTYDRGYLTKKSLIKDGSIYETDTYSKGTLTRKEYISNGVIDKVQNFSKYSTTEYIYSNKVLTERNIYVNNTLTEKYKYSGNHIIEKDIYSNNILAEKSTYNYNGKLTGVVKYDGSGSAILKSGTISTDRYGVSVISYGQADKWAKLLDYRQGDNRLQYKNDGGLVACENVLIEKGRLSRTSLRYGVDNTESNVVNLASMSGNCIKTAPINYYKGGTTVQQQEKVLEYFGVQATSGFCTLEGLGESIKHGLGVIVEVASSLLWGRSSNASGLIDHAVTVTGVEYNYNDPTDIEGFYICDSGRGVQSDSMRYLSYDTMKSIFCCEEKDGVDYGMAVVTDTPKRALPNCTYTGIDINSIIQQLSVSTGQECTINMSSSEVLNNPISLVMQG